MQQEMVFQDELDKIHMKSAAMTFEQLDLTYNELFINHLGLAMANENYTVIAIICEAIDKHKFYASASKNGHDQHKFYASASKNQDPQIVHNYFTNLLWNKLSNLEKANHYRAYASFCMEVGDLNEAKKCLREAKKRLAVEKVQISYVESEINKWNLMD